MFYFRNNDFVAVHNLYNKKMYLQHTFFFSCKNFFIKRLS